MWCLFSPGPTSELTFLLIPHKAQLDSGSFPRKVALFRPAALIHDHDHDHQLFSVSS